MDLNEGWDGGSDQSHNNEKMALVSRHTLNIRYSEGARACSKPDSIHYRRVRKAVGTSLPRTPSRNTSCRF
ncbi:hypothetical protein M8818_004276 [Zalaria obscura]|uniref:Uncharacterized protein n=1 Tax=Zalaria obscura TaxID=2024903 RepID=A0ACC3SCZ0_9PEZI